MADSGVSSRCKCWRISHARLLKIVKMSSILRCWFSTKDLKLVASVTWSVRSETEAAVPVPLKYIWVNDRGVLSLRFGLSSSRKSFRRFLWCLCLWCRLREGDRSLLLRRPSSWDWCPSLGISFGRLKSQISKKIEQALANWSAFKRKLTLSRPVLLRTRFQGRRGNLGTKLSLLLPTKGRFRADLHDTILSHATASRQAYDMTYDCRSVLKH